MPLPEQQSAGILGPGQLSALWSLRLLPQQVWITVTCFWLPCTLLPAVLELRFLRQQVNCLECDFSGTQAGVC